MFFKHFTVVVKDLEQSIRFYQTMAELTVRRRFSEGAAELAFLCNAQGETEIELVCTPDMQCFVGKGFFLCFETDKLDDMHALALSKQLNPSGVRNPSPGVRYFYVYDPDGVSVQLRQKA